MQADKKTTLSSTIQPSSGAAGTALRRHHPVCSMFFHLCVVWIGHKTGQELTTEDHQVCRESFSPAFPPSCPCTSVESGNGQERLLQAPPLW